MSNILIVFLIVLFTFIFFCLMYYAKQKKQAKQPQYICSHCGEKHCDCQKQ